MAFCRKLLGDSDFEAPVLCQDIRELQLAAFRFAPSYWGSAISSLLSGVKLLGNCNLQGLALFQAIVELQIAGFRAVPSQVGNSNIVRFCLTPSYWGSAISRLLPCVKLLCNYQLHVFALCQAIVSSKLQGIVLSQAIGGLQVIMYLKHAPHVERPVHRIS